ncbi:MAG: PhnD/SsuA/transferrin family substrate-binding protein, partial [Alphaproteobacteria bacterium]
PAGGKSPNYQSLFVVRQDSAVTALAEVRNHRIAVGDPHSTSGYNMPRRELADIGIRIDSESDFSEIIQASNHDEALRLIINGVVDVAPVSSVNYHENIRSGVIGAGQLRIIHRSPDIPGAPLVYAAALAPALKRRIKETVLRAHEHMEIGGYGGLLERYVDPAEARLKLLEAYIRPQWSWRTYLAIGSLIGVIWLVGIDLVRGDEHGGLGGGAEQAPGRGVRGHRPRCSGRSPQGGHAPNLRRGDARALRQQPIRGGKGSFAALDRGP